MEKPTGNVIAYPESAIDPETTFFNSMRLYTTHMKNHPVVPVKRAEKFLPESMGFGRIQWHGHQFWCLLQQSLPQYWTIFVSGDFLNELVDAEKVELLRWTTVDDAKAMCAKDLESLDFIDQFRAAIMINDLPQPTELDRRRIIRHARESGERIRAMFAIRSFRTTPAIRD